MALNWRGKDTGSDTPSAVLQEVFGHGEFRPSQEEVIEAMVQGHNVLHIAPSGSGKSITYQVPSVLQPKGSTTLVVSPLIALMRGQVATLTEQGIPAATLHSQMPDAPEVLQQLHNGTFAQLFIAPEQLRRHEFQDAMEGVRVPRIVVDEAHCISQWGRDFRPDYRTIGAAAERLGSPPIAAFTATASAKVRADILSSIGKQDWHQFVESPLRRNLTYGVTQVKDDEERFAAVMRSLKKHLGKRMKDGKAIIYNATQRATEETHKALEEEGLNVGYYHAGRTDGDRRRVEQGFVGNEFNILSATNAFGMGIDVPDIRFIGHTRLPGTVEAYLQETGRAGRDGKKSHCELYFNEDDAGLQEFFNNQRTPDIGFITSVYRVLNAQGSGKTRVHGFFHANWYGLKRSFDRKPQRGPPIPRDTEVNAAISMLEEVGVLEIVGSMVKVGPFSEAEPAFATVAGITETRRKIGQATFGQMLRYGRADKPNQQMLIEMMEEELSVS